jgi:multidrug resistance efflux pump
VPVSAPFSGVVYRIYREQGEQVNRGQSLLSLLDCQSLWAEAVVSAADAARINVQQPVLAYLTGSVEPIQGEVELVQPLGPEQIVRGAEESQVWAIAPVIPPTLAGQTVQRIKVRIPPPPQYENSQQFCGVGQTIRLSFRKQR